MLALLARLSRGRRQRHASESLALSPRYLRKLLDAGRYPQVRERVGERPARHGADLPLSEREAEILRYVAAGYSNAQIAQILVVEPSTVKWHLTNIFGKLDVRSRTQALTRARELGLLASTSGT